MIVQFFRYGNGLSKGPLDYLLGKDRDRDYAKVLQGDVSEVSGLIDTSPYAKKYTSGCLSFYEHDLSDQDKQKIMQDFEQALFPGMDQSQYRVLWIEHQDKLNEETGERRLELNFLIPNVEILTGKRLQPYYDKADRPRIDLFKKITNYEYQLHDADDPLYRQAVTTAKNLPKTVNEIKETLDIEATRAVESGLITDRQSMKKWLLDLGLEVTRETKKSLSIKNPNDDEKARPIRLTGAIYEQDFRLTETSQQLTIAASERYRREAEQRNAGDIQRYRAHIERKSAELNDKYRHNTNEHTSETERIYSRDHTTHRAEHPENSVIAQQTAGAVHSRSTSAIGKIKPLEYRYSGALKDSRYFFEVKSSFDFNSMYSSYFCHLNERNQLREIHSNQRAQSADSSYRQRNSSENTRINGFIQPDPQRKQESQIEQTDEYASTVINDYRRSAEEASRCFNYYSKTEHDNRTARQLQQRTARESYNFDRLSKEANSSLEQYSVSRFITNSIESIERGFRQSFEALDRLIRHQVISVDRDRIINRNAIKNIQATLEHSATEYTATLARAGQTSNRTGSEADQAAVNDRIGISARTSRALERFDTANISKALNELDRRKEVQLQQSIRDTDYDSPSPF